jgi:hypothetical protein
MIRAECPRELEVLDALASKRWPDRMGEDLTRHVADCACCKDLAVVAEALRADFSMAISQAKVPSAGLVWWRAQIRARQESLVTANRPITIAHYVGAGLTGAAILVLLFVFDFGGIASLSFSALSDLIPDSVPVPMLVAVLIGFIASASIAVYSVFSDR